MICNSITEVYNNKDLLISNTKINHFGVAFHVEYDFKKENETNGVLGINYTIKLAQDKNKLFGQIDCRYEFSLVMDDSDLDNEEISETVVRNCLKLNHNNIFNLVEKTLRENKIIKKDERNLLH